MYRTEVPQYGELLSLVAQVNQQVLDRSPEESQRLQAIGDLERLSEERHGAIRLGLPAELALIGRAFAVMGMRPVGYYNLAPAGVPVHSTAFRPVEVDELKRNPFRVFTSLLRLELIEDDALRAEAASALSRRSIITPDALALIETAEDSGGLDEAQSDRFVKELLETFRWHSEATVSAPTYERLLAAHRLIADVVSFKGPHINHLTPRTLDIDAVQAEMPRRGIAPKETIEGPPARACPILLRQTSFKALNESIAFPSESGLVEGRHTARFGEIEQRGCALTPKGRALYDELLQDRRLGKDTFDRFPDDWDRMRHEGLAWFRYETTPQCAEARRDLSNVTIEALIQDGYVVALPITYEDFLPVSAAGIFQSNLGAAETRDAYAVDAARADFEAALGLPLLDEMALYRQAQERSLAEVRATLGGAAILPAAVDA